ncbi:MAG TPA: nitrogenase component 1 [bacterium]|nr:nitrogenase component 1 [bacterium]
MEEATLPVNYSYIIGLYLAVNAIPDLFLYMDGPDCSTYKAEYIYGRHDLNSTLLNCSGSDRIVRPRNLDVTSIVHDRTADIKKILHETCMLPEAGGLMYASMPMATITGTQYDSIIRDGAPELSKPIFEIPSLSLSSDWIDGYSQAMKSLAKGLNLEGDPDPACVAVIGYMMDRNEKDHTSNVDQLENMLRGLSLDPVSIWLSGRPLSHLERAGRAGVVISLPHGREAARIIASRTGAKLVETGIPFGLNGTVRWLEQIGSALGLEEQAASYSESELGRVLPGIKWIINRGFLGRRFFFGGDPHMMEPVRNFFNELGCSPSAMIAVAQEKHLTPLPKSLVQDRIPCRFNLCPGEIAQITSEAFRDGCDIIVAGDLIRNYINNPPGVFASVPFGFTNYHRHALADAPYLGFCGALHFMDFVANEIMRAQADTRRRQPPRS